MQNNRGFTLIEILVVLLIIGITLGFALLAFGDFGSSRRVVTAAEQFINYIKLAQHQAILETTTLGISLDQHGYQVLRFQPPKAWHAMPQAIFKQQHFPENTIFRFENTSNKLGMPQIVINSSGDMTSFTLVFSTNKQANIVSVIGDTNGTVKLQPMKSP